MCDRKIHGHLGIGNMRWITKGHEKNFRDDGYIHCLDFVMVSWVYTYGRNIKLYTLKYVHVSCMSITHISIKLLTVWMVFNHLCKTNIHTNHCTYRRLPLKRHWKMIKVLPFVKGN